MKIVKGDLNVDASIRRVLAGVRGVFGVQNPLEVEQVERQGKRPAALEKRLLRLQVDQPTEWTPEKIEASIDSAIAAAFAKCLSRTHK